MKIINGLLLFGLTATCTLHARKHWTQEETNLLMSITAPHINSIGFITYDKWPIIVAEFNELSTHKRSEAALKNHFMITKYDLRNEYYDGPWTQSEDESLAKIASEYEGKKNWEEISKRLESVHERLRHPRCDCMRRFENSIKNKNIGAWTQEENEMLLRLVSMNPGMKYSEMGEALGRTAKACRERLTSLSNQSINPEFTQEDDARLLELLKKFGTEWNKMAKYFPDKNSLLLKNRYKELTKQGNLQAIQWPEIPQKSTSSEDAFSLDEFFANMQHIDFLTIPPFVKKN